MITTIDKETIELMDLYHLFIDTKEIIKHGYRVKIDTYGGRSGFTDSKRVSVFKDERQVFESFSSYRFSFNFVSFNNKIYFVANANNTYESFSIFDLEEEKEYPVLPKDCFCGVTFHSIENENKKYLIVEGCYWAAGYDIRIYDVTDFNGINLTNYDELPEGNIIDLNIKNEKLVLTTKEYYEYEENTYKSIKLEEPKIVYIELDLYNHDVYISYKEYIDNIK